MISRFSCLLRDALDQIFDYYCTSDDGPSLSKEDVNKFLIRTNGQLGRGGTWRHTKVIFEKKREEGASISVTMNRQDWYGIFARELGEGKWWQVMHDLEVCGACLRPSKIHRNTSHYQGWLDYIYLTLGDYIALSSRTQLRLQKSPAYTMTAMLCRMNGIHRIIFQ